MTIKVLFLDVDGTLTDGQIIISSDGTETKHFSVKDGMGISIARKAGIIPVIITGRSSECVSIRARELGITEVYQGISDKVQLMNDVLNRLGDSFDEAAYSDPTIKKLLEIINESVLPDDGDDIDDNNENSFVS